MQTATKQTKHKALIFFLHVYMYLTFFEFAKDAWHKLILYASTCPAFLKKKTVAQQKKRTK
jgi:hypothetical protein